MVSIQVEPEFGFVVFVIIASMFMIQWLGFRVGMARKKYDVKVSIFVPVQDDCAAEMQILLTFDCFCKRKCLECRYRHSRHRV